MRSLRLRGGLGGGHRRLVGFCVESGNGLLTGFGRQFHDVVIGRLRIGLGRRRFGQGPGLRLLGHGRGARLLAGRHGIAAELPGEVEVLQRQVFRALDGGCLVGRRGLLAICEWRLDLQRRVEVVQRYRLVRCGSRRPAGFGNGHCGILLARPAESAHARRPVLVVLAQTSIAEAVEILEQPLADLEQDRKGGGVGHDVARGRAVEAAVERACHLGHGRTGGHLRGPQQRVTEHAQLLRRAAAVGGLLPAAQLLLDPRHQVEGFAGEDLGQLAVGTRLRGALRNHRLQGIEPLQHRRGVLACDSRRADFGDPARQLRHRLAQQAEPPGIERQMRFAQGVEIGLERTGQLAERRRVDDARGAAQRVKRAHGLGIHVRRAVALPVQPAFDGCQLLADILAEDLGNVGLRRCGGRPASRIFARVIEQRRQRVGLRNGTGLAERVDQLRQQAERLADGLDDARRHRRRAIETLVEHVLQGPAELADLGGTDRPATALERVEGPAQRRQRIAILRVTAPAVVGGLQGLPDFGRFLEEDLADLGVGAGGELVLRRNGGERVRRKLLRRLGHDIGNLERQRRIGPGFLGLDCRGLDRLAPLGGRRFEPATLLQQIHALAQVGEDAGGTRQTRTLRLDVVLDGRDRVRIAVCERRLLAQPRVAGRSQMSRQATAQVGRLRLGQHLETRRDLLEQADAGRQVGIGTAAQVGVDRRLDPGEVDQELAVERIATFGQIARRRHFLRQLAGGGVGELHLPEQRVLQVVLDPQDRRGQLHQQRRLRFVGRRLAQALGLARDHVLQAHETQCPERATDVDQPVRDRPSAHAAVVAGAHHQVDLILDARELAADLGRDLGQQGRVGAMDASAHLLQRRRRRQVVVEIEGLAQRLDARAARRRTADQEQELQRQVGGLAGGRILARGGQQLELCREPPEQALEFERIADAAAEVGLDGGGGRAPELMHGGVRGVLRHLLGDLAGARRTGLRIRTAAHPGDERGLEQRQQPLRLLLCTARLDGRVLRRRQCRAEGLQLRDEQLAFGEHRLAARQTQFVDRRLHDQRAVRHAVGQRMDVVAELHRRAQQCAVQRLGLGDALLREILDASRHLRGDGGKSEALDHRRGATDLVQLHIGLLQLQRIAAAFGVVVD